MVSVIIPLYNKEKEISKAINSVLNQSFSDFELIIVNDGSTDKSMDLVERIHDTRIRLINKPNGGVSSARNRGIKEAKFELVAFLDGDDWWDLNFLSNLIELTKKYPDAGLWAGQYVQVDKKNKIIRLDRFPEIDEGYFELYNHLFAVWSSSVIIRKAVFKNCGVFDEELSHGEDTDMWIRIALKYKICYTEKTVAYYNIGNNPLTKSTGKVPVFEKRFISKIDNYIGLGYKEWDDLLNHHKAVNLRKFYIQYPYNKNIISMINNLPSKIIYNKMYLIFKVPRIIIIISHYLLVFYQKIKKVKNGVFLNINRIKLLLLKAFRNIFDNDKEKL